MSLIDLLVVVFFFFFKQKTAYEMRISDWSSDVCSSDLMPRKTMPIGTARIWAPTARRFIGPVRVSRTPPTRSSGESYSGPFWALRMPVVPKRSEEHTSELQSLMRISYAVFCLKKKTPQRNNTRIHQQQMRDHTHQQS